MRYMIVLFLIVVGGCDVKKQVTRVATEHELSKRRAEQLVQLEAGNSPQERDIRRDLESLLLQAGLDVINGGDGGPVIIWLKEAQLSNSNPVDTLVTLINDPHLHQYATQELLVRYGVYYGRLPDGEFESLLQQAVAYYSDYTVSSGEVYTAEFLRLIGGYVDIE